MKLGPDITRIAALLGDPARANMLSALMGGQALTAGELAREAGVTPQTASSHLAQLAGRAGHMRTRPGPRDPAMRKARVCYNHLAGDAGVAMLDALVAQGRIAEDTGSLVLTAKGRAFARDFG